MMLTEDLFLPPGYPALYLKNKKTVIISDLHLGFESAVASEGIYLPRIQLKKAIELIMALSRVTNAYTLVINGDLKHVFEKLTIQEREEITKFLSVAKDTYKEIVLIRGNHDNYITIVTDRFDVPIVPKLSFDEEVVAIHGHEYDDQVLSHKYIVIGHEHPSLRISDELGGVLRFSSFLLTPLINGSMALVLPAAGHYQTGNPLSLDSSQYLSPLLKEKGIISEAIPFVLDFGKLTIEFPSLSKINISV